MTQNYCLEYIDGLGKRITALREQKGMLKSQLAKKIGVSFSALDRWEKGQYMPTWNNAVKLAKAFGMPVKDLIGEEAVKQIAAHKRELLTKENKENNVRGTYFGYIEGLGDRIYHLRKRAGLTQKQLGEKVGISFRSISYYESNRVSPSSKVAQKLADAFGISLAELLGKETDHAENHGNHD